MDCDCDEKICRWCWRRLTEDYAEAVLRLVQAGQDVTDFGIHPRQLMELRWHLTLAHEEKVTGRHWITKLIEGHRPRR